MAGKEIMVLERPETVSWEEISFVLKQAHAENVKNGILLPYSALPPDKLFAKTEGRGGKMLVALDDGKVIGTGAVAIIDKCLWCGKGKYAYCFLDAVLPEYRGKGVYRQIVSWQEKYAESVGVDRMLFDTHEQNKRMIKISKKNGYRLVEYRVRDGRNSVVLVKWLNDCPFSRLRCFIKYNRIKHDRKKAAKSKVKL